MSRTFWPIAEAAQADYEQLRAAVLAGTPAVGRAAARFERDGLWGLIARPQARPLFVAGVVGAARPAWSPHVDPRLVALADGFEIIVAATAVTVGEEQAG
jgi:hypothetical protein